MSKINKILIGSNNKGKFKEIADLLPSELKKISPNQFKIDSPEENGKTFIENSEIKADFYCKKTNIVTIADDSGLEIDCLNGMPGIFSSRWADQHGGFENAMVEILKKVNKVNENKEIKNTKARFVCALTIKWPSGKKISEQGIIEGNILSIKGENGFGYDAIFTPKNYSITFGEMDFKKKVSIDHRFLAYRKLQKKIKDYF